MNKCILLELVVIEIELVQELVQEQERGMVEVLAAEREYN
jgi:hypothetical protein